MAFILHFDEHTREVLNIIRKALDPLLVFASRAGRSVLQRSASLFIGYSEFTLRTYART